MLKIGVSGIVALAALCAVNGAEAQDLNVDELKVVKAMYQQVQPCWDGVADQPDFTRLVVKVQIMLKEDGSLRGDPVLLVPEHVPEADSEMKIAIDRALHAVTACAPYSLPENKMEWPRPVNINFGPKFSEARVLG